MNMMTFYGKECNYYFGERLKDEDYDVFFCPTKEYDESQDEIIEDLSDHYCYIDSCILWAAYFIEAYEMDFQWYSIKIQSPDKLEKEYYTYDSLLEDVWKTFIDVNIDEDENIEQNWFIFPEGTSRDYIWHWFDKRHSKGVYWLIYGIE